MSDATVIGVLGASGGVGASTLVGGLAQLQASEGHRVACLDGRCLGGGLDTILGLDREPGLRWNDLRGARGSLTGAGLLSKVPSTRGIAVISHGRDAPMHPPEDAWLAVLDAARSETDFCFVDLPDPYHPGFSSALSAAAMVLLVVGASVCALAGAGVVGAHVSKRSAAPVWLCQRVTRSDADLPALVSEALSLPLAGTIPDDPALAKDLRSGNPPGARAVSFRRSCGRILTAVGTR